MFAIVRNNYMTQPEHYYIKCIEIKNNDTSRQN